jgi:hypothetical protein
MPIRRGFLLSQLVLLLVLLAAPAFAEPQQFGEIGDLKLVSGELLRECRVGYRTYGKMNADKSNVIVYPTWANGRTEQMDGGMAWLRDAGFYVITVDALANGVSSSPSNSRFQPRMKFPKITMRDMVESQHELLTRVLHIHHVKAKLFIVITKNDHTVTTGPALEFAKKLGAAPFILDNSCGHSIHACPDNGMGQAILKFLGP